MLEEVEYDILIPLTPFNSNPKYLQSLSKKISLSIIDWETLEKTISPWNFLSSLKKIGFNLVLQKYSNELDELSMNNEGESLFVTITSNFEHFLTCAQLFVYSGSTIKRHGLIMLAADNLVLAVKVNFEVLTTKTLQRRKMG